MNTEELMLLSEQFPEKCVTDVFQCWHFAVTLDNYKWQHEMQVNRESGPPSLKLSTDSKEAQSWIDSAFAG